MPDRRPSRDNTLMATAGVWSQRSTCSRASVGAVIAIDGRIIVTGYNGAPAGMPHCDHTCVCGADNRLFHDHRDGCSADLPCRVAVHAEANAIAFAAKNGLATGGGELFVTLSPCYVCAQIIINAGISRVIVGELYRDLAGYNLLISAGIEVNRK